MSELPLFSGITTQPLVGLFVLLPGLTGLALKPLDYHASAVSTALTDLAEVQGMKLEFKCFRFWLL